MGSTADRYRPGGATSGSERRRDNGCALLRLSAQKWRQVIFLSAFCIFCCLVNRLTPNDPYMGRTAPLTSKRCILYIYSTNVGTEYFKHALYSPFFSLQMAVCFIMLTCLVPILFTFYVQNVLKLKKNNSDAKGLKGDCPVRNWGYMGDVSLANDAVFFCWKWLPKLGLLDPTVGSSETSGTARLLMRCHTPEDFHYLLISVSCCELLLVGILPRRPGFDPRSVRMGSSPRSKRCY